MAAKDEFEVNGYHFGSLEDAERAGEEIKKAEYFEERLSGRRGEALLAVYDKILDEKVFQTPIGWEYLRRLQERLLKDGILEEQIRAIPMYASFGKRSGSMLETERLRQRVKPSRKRPKLNVFHISLLVNVLLTVLVFAMFFIALKSDNPNILNYRKAVVNEYASWDQELTERERAVREKEKELSLTNSQ